MTLPLPFPKTLLGAALALTALSSQAVTLVGLTSSNEIARIDTTNVAAATSMAISGLDAGDRFVGIDRTLLDAVRKSAKMRDQFADHASLRAAQEFLAWSERTAELQRVALTSGGAAGFAFGGMLLSEAEAALPKVPEPPISPSLA